MLIIFFVDVTFVRRVSRSHAIATAPIYIARAQPKGCSEFLELYNGEGSRYSVP